MEETRVQVSIARGVVVVHEKAPCYQRYTQWNGYQGFNHHVV